MFLPAKENGLVLTTKRNDNTNLEFWVFVRKI